MKVALVETLACFAYLMKLAGNLWLNFGLPQEEVQDVRYRMATVVGRHCIQASEFGSLASARPQPPTSLGDCT